MNGDKRSLAKGFIPKKLEKNFTKKRTTYHDGRRSSRKEPHPRHKNGNGVDHGKCPRCIIIHGEKDTEVTEIEEHHEIPREYGGRNGSIKKGCPDCHVEVHLLYDRYKRILIMQNLFGFVEISQRYFNGEALTEGDLMEIALRSTRVEVENKRENL
ncbi:MAG TPA: hypothetical protein PLD14_03170 [Candidatus Pacearchaeota archaeon]|nr:hypothetical protein [Candidatus Pacearchaeota archaeon]HPR80198.1 hypothetical protein [Candidatus Pacearchaeota archaeon]